MNTEKATTAAAGSRLADSAGCAMAEVRQMTVRECIAASIDGHNQQIARLMTLRDTTPNAVLDMPQRTLAALVYPDNQF